MKACCFHANQPGVVAYYCENCDLLTCGWHTAIWTDDVGRCPFCFKKVRQLTKTSNPEIVKGYIEADGEKQTLCIVIDG